MTTPHFNTPLGATAIAAPFVSSQVTSATSSASTSTASKRAYWIEASAHYAQTDNALIDRAARHIGVYGVALFQALVRHADFGTGESFPTIEMLMEELSISEPTACKYIALLEGCQMITKRGTRWGTREQGPKSRNFYRILPANQWDFSSLEKPVVSAPKEVMPGLKEIGSNKKHQFKKNEVQNTTHQAKKAKIGGVVVSSIASDVLLIEEQLCSRGMNALVAHRLVQADAHECEFQLKRLAREAKAPRKVAAWLVRAIEGRYRDSDAWRRAEKKHELLVCVENEPQEQPRRTRATSEGLSPASEGLNVWLDSIKPQSVEVEEVPLEVREDVPPPQERAQIEVNRRAKERFLTLPPARQQELRQQAQRETAPFLWDRLDVPDSPISWTLWALVPQEEEGA